MLKRFVSTFFAVLLPLFVAGTVAAQTEEPTPSEIAAARSLFQSGLEAAKNEDWEQARRRFLRSYNIAQRPATLLNLARAEKETRHFVEAVDHYRRFLAGVKSGPLAQFREEAVKSLAEAKRRSAAVIIRVVGLDKDDSLEVDSKIVPRDVLGVPLALNPGSHWVRILRQGRRIGSKRLNLREGERVNLELRVRPKPKTEPEELPATPAAPENPPKKGGGVLSSPVFWVTVAVVLAAGVAGATIFLANQSGGEDVPDGNLGAGTVEF